MADSKKSSFDAKIQTPFKMRAALRSRSKMQLQEVKNKRPSHSVPESEIFKGLSRMNKKALEIVSNN
ncbi:hypothetical protein [Metabacillus sp. RGM 3146]|uniref:hypothetical protein n=1 Tax=Metabacillus sp. RGM 3146 TaxID=3401092 RepID=UPI003B99569A